MAIPDPRLKRDRWRHGWRMVVLLAAVGFGLVALWRLAREAPATPPAPVPREPGAAPTAPRASAGSVAPAPSVAADAPRDPIFGYDRYAEATPLAERWFGPADASTRQRWRILPTGDALFPAARVVDHLTRDPASGAWRLHAQEIMRPDAVIVAVPAGLTADAVAAQVRGAGFIPAPGHPGDAVIVALLSEATLDAVPDALVRLQAEFPGFKAEPDFLRFPSQAVPNEYDPAVLWGLENIEAPAAWSVTTGSSSVVVAVFDSGMDASHPDLAPNLWTNPGEIPANGSDDDGNGFIDDVHGWDFAANSAVIIDNDGHGTHVSGTIGAAGNNGQGVTGVNWNVRLLPLRVGNGTFPDSALINAVRYITALRNRATHPVNIVAANASLGGFGFSSTFRQELASAGTAGILLVAAAGNDGTNNDTTPSYPASYDLDSVIAVAALHLGSGRSKFSNFGATSVDLAAPGSAVFSTVRNGGYGYNSGTSMAAPHVTGAVALVAAATPGATAAERRARILDSVEPVPALAGVVATGGKLNLRRAVAPALLRPRVAITSPSARVMAIDRPGLSIALAATVLPERGATAVATLLWDAPEGPVPVNFSQPAGASTTATFPAPGRYRVRVRAVAGALQESDAIVVAVGDVQPDGNGLRAHWNFDEASGAALDTSGDNRTGMFNGATRTPGVLGSALSLNGTTANVSFAAPPVSRVTIAGWARANGAGNSVFPRVVHMRPGLLFFGLDGGASSDDGNNGTLKFALDDGTATPVWHTPPGSVALDTWFHVAVTYDPTAPAPAPRFYINGAPQLLGIQAAGAASAPTVGAGQGFIGDRGDALRAWLGQLDEVRIYDRELNASEVALLGHEVTLQSVVGGTLTRGTLSNPFTVPLVFAPATTGLGAVGFTQIAWTCDTAGVTISPATGVFAPTMTVPGTGDFLVRCDATSGDGVHAVRTLQVTVVADPVTIPGYYTGTTSDGGVFVLRVASDGVGTFFGGGGHGRHRLGFSVANWGGFSFTDQTGASITGLIDAAGGVTGTITGGTTFAGARLNSGFGAADTARDGEYAGWVLDSGIRAVAHVERGRVALVVEESGAHRAAEGVINAAGNFALVPATGATVAGNAGGEKLTADIALPGRPPRRVVMFREGFNPVRRLANLSLRGFVGTAEAALIPGFVVQGSDALPMLVRGIGPALIDFNVPGFIARPRLQLFNGPGLLQDNFGWASAVNATEISAAAARVHAFPLDPARLDSAVVGTLVAGAYTAIITGNDGGTGVALAEAYDARLGTEAARLINLSGRGHVGTGANILIGGFVVAGDAPALVLVRGIGPSLADFNVFGVLQQPVLTVFRGPTAFSSGTAWAASESATEIAAASILTSAFSLPANSADAAQLLFLEPGSYTAQVSGANDTTGIALVEIYLVPDF